MSSLRHAVLDALRHGEHERFDFSPGPALDRALGVALAGPQPADELSEVLRLVVALEQSLGSPAAAEGLRAWLKRSPGARGVLGQLFGAARGLDTGRRFAAREGREAAPTAGMYGAAAPEGALSVRRFLSAAPPLPRPGSVASAVGTSPSGRVAPAHVARTVVGPPAARAPAPRTSVVRTVTAEPAAAPPRPIAPARTAARASDPRAQPGDRAAPRPRSA